jgi:UMF1 family MFS transporter
MHSPPSPGREDSRTLFGWYMYDWANSAYSTTVLAGLLGPYLIGMSPEDVQVAGFSFSSEALYMLAAAAAAALIFVIAPILGAMADFSGAKKPFLIFFAYMGALSTTLLYFADVGGLWYALVVFLVAQTAFVAANVFYDAFLPSIASTGDMDAVSGRGFAYGYVGGGLQFLIALLLVTLNEQLGIERDTAARIGMGMAGLWWGGFTVFTVKYLREDGPGGQALPSEVSHLPKAIGYVTVGLTRTIETTQKIRRFRHLLLFLVAFLFYNDGIQTAILVTSTYGKAELMLDETVLMVTLLVIQVVGTGGALVFSRLADWIGTRYAVMVSLAGWSLLVFYAYSLQPGQSGLYVLMGGLAGLVLGGSQALSRSLYGSMIPGDASAEFYGFYSVFSKFSAIWGPFVLFLGDTYFGSLRSAIPSLIIFFVLGMILLYFVDEESAREASARGAF